MGQWRESAARHAPTSCGHCPLMMPGKEKVQLTQPGALSFKGSSCAIILTHRIKGFDDYGAAFFLIQGNMAHLGPTRAGRGGYFLKLQSTFNSHLKYSPDCPGDCPIGGDPFEGSGRHRPTRPGWAHLAGTLSPLLTRCQGTRSQVGIRPLSVHHQIIY